MEAGGPKRKSDNKGRHTSPLKLQGRRQREVTESVTKDKGGDDIFSIYLYHSVAAPHNSFVP